MAWYGRAWFIATSAVVAVLGWIGIQESEGIVAGLSVQGVSHSPAAFHGFSGTGARREAFQSWHLFAVRPNGGAIVTWLDATISFDLLFIAGFTLFLVGMRRRFVPQVWWWLPLLPAEFDLIEDAVSTATFHELHRRSTLPDLVVTTATWATWAKWLAVAGVLVVAGYQVGTVPEARARLRRGSQALSTHRFALGILAVLAVLLLLPGAPILQQAVDIERSWFLTDHPFAGALYATAAVGAALLVALVLRYLSSVQIAVFGEAGLPPFAGGFRTAWRPMWVWFGIAAAVPLAAHVLEVTGRVTVYWPSLFVVAGVLAAVGATTFATARVTAPGLAAVGADRAVLTWKTGRLLAWTVPVVLALSVARAFMAPLVLDQDRGTALTLFLAGAVVASAITIVVCTVGGEPQVIPHDPVAIAELGAKRYVHPQVVGMSDSRTPAWRACALVAAVVVAAGALVLAFPVRTSTALGGVGVTFFALAGLSAFYLLLRVIAQRAATPRIFRVLRLRQVPIVAVVLVMATVGSLVGASNPLHDIRRPPGVSPNTGRPPLSDAVRAWLDRPAGSCAVGFGSDPTTQFRPMVFVAAEGGGMRAAWWTNRAVQTLTGTRCGSQSLFVASGVSGGAVGLAVAATAADPAAAETAMNEIADGRALAATLDGFLTRDLLAGALGVNVRGDGGPRAAGFPDRADLLEQGWEQEDPALATQGPASPVPWHIVYNGTSVRGSCRVVVSDLDFGSAARTCGNAVIPGAYDFYQRYPCMTGVRRTTEALLAARFPYVTPSGVVECTKDPHHADADQIVDGGYAENSGMDTVDAILSQAMPTIRSHNAAEMTKPVHVLAVPVLVFLHNSPGAAVGADAPFGKAVPEVTVPPLTEGAGAILGDNAVLIRRFLGDAQAWQPEGLSPTAETAFAAGYSQAVTVAPGTRGQLAFPLGWSLSQATRRAMDAAFDDHPCEAVPSATAGTCRALGF